MTETATAFATTERTDSLLAVVGAGLPVPLVTGATVPYANLDYAASAPALRVVAEHLATALPYYASVHRGAGYASQVSTALLENSRLCIGRFLGAREDDLVVALTRAEGLSERCRGLTGVLAERRRSVAMALEVAAGADVINECYEHVSPIERSSLCNPKFDSV